MTRNTPNPSRLLLALALLSGGAGCARTAEPVKEPEDARGAEHADRGAATGQEQPTDAEASRQSASEQFEAFVAERNTCSSDSECVVLSPGCPLGCGVGVRAERAPEVEAKAEALLAEQEAAAGRCTYKCAALHPQCQAGRCAAVTE